MEHGGRRPGAGRRKGSRNRANATREKLIAQGGITPVAVMVAVMRHAYAMGQQELNKEKPNEKKLRWAFELALQAAHRAAAFVHQRFAPVDPSARLDLTKLSKEDVDVVEPILRKASDAAPGEGADSLPPEPQC